MDIQDKTKQELINELMELRDAYDSLKALIKSDLPQSEHTKEALHKSGELLKNIEQAAKIGGWEFDVETNKQTWTDEIFHILEIDTSLGAPDVPEGIGFIAPEYQPIALLAIKRAIEFGEPYNQEWVIITAKGNKRWINAIATPTLENGKTKSVSGSFQDISKRKLAEIALREKEENLIITLNSIGDAVISTDKNGLVVSMNPIAERLCGWNLTDASGKPLADVFTIINSETRQTVADPVKKVLEKGEIVGLANHTVLVSKNGAEYQIADSAAPIRNNDGAITGVVLVFSDITESYIAQKLIKESEERYRLLFQNHTAGFALHEIILNAEGKPCDYRFLEINPAFEALTGLKAIDLIGKTVMEVMPNIEPSWIERYGEVALKGNNFNFENYSNDLNKYFQVSAYSPEPGKFATVFLDITERKQSELLIQEKTEEIEAQNEELIQTNLELAEARKNAEENEARLKMALEVSNSGAWDWDILKNTFYWSDEFLQLFGLPANTIAGFEAWIKALHPEDVKTASAKIQEAIENQKELLNDYRIILPNKEIRWIRATGQTTYENNQPVRMIGLCMDITRQKTVEQELNLAKLRAEESEEKYRDIVNLLPQVIFESDSSGNLTYLNNNAFKVFGYPDDYQILGKCSLDFYTPESRIKAIENIRQKVTGNQGGLGSEYVMVRKDGSTFSALVYSNPIIKGGKPVGLRGIIVDITELKKTEQALRDSEERFKNMFERHSSNMLLIEPETGMIIGANEASTRFYGYSEAELLAMRINEINIFSPENIKAEREHAVRGERNYFVFPHRLANGEIRTVEVYSSPIVFKDKQILFSIIHDITERKLAEEKMKESEAKYRKLYEFNQMPIAIFDVETLEFLSVNNAWVEKYGYTKEELFSMTILEIRPESEQERVKQSVRQISKGLENVGEYLHKKKNGEIIKVEIIRYDLEFEGRNAKLVFANDITERKQAEEKLRESEAIKNKMVSNIGDVIVIIDQNGINRYKSPNITALFGWLPEELVGKSTWDTIHSDDLDATKKFIAILAAEPNATATIETRYKRKDGKYVWIEITIANLLTDPDINGLLGNYHEITERKRIELELITAKLHAEESDRLKSAFLANMSHEIRTPMNGILGFAELLKEPDLTGEQQKQYIRIIEKSGVRMLNIINDIVDISKIEAGLMKLDIKESNINEQVEYICTFFKPEVEAKGMKISFKNALPAKEAIIKTDREKVYSILTNLVKNAIKYSNEGTIELGYELKGKDIEYFVKDTGIGIPKERQEAIFERFIQADIIDVEARQGAGLGLSISKAYIEMLGGKIWVESEVGSGSAFYFTLPYNAELAKETLYQQHGPSATIDHVRKLKILIAEDDDVSEMLMAINMNEFGTEILNARTGVEAIEVCKINPDIDLVLMDIRMPEMGGYEATRHIREFNKEVVIIAQTAYGLTGDKEKAIEAGCNDYIAKPIPKAELQTLILKYFGK